MIPKDVPAVCPVPVPKEWSVGGEFFDVFPAVSAPPEFSRQADVLRGYIARLYGASVPAVGPEADAGIRLIFDGTLSGEAYALEAAQGAVTVRAAAVSGFSRGCAALLQLLRRRGGALTVPDCTLRDAPDTAWRGMMVDLARGSYPFKELLVYADLCYYYRLSVLHFHFADGCGYKLPSRRFPALPCEGAYTDGELRRLTEYLRDRGIMLLPEIEMPAHARPLAERYPDRFGDHKKMICPGHPGVFEALDELIGDVCDVFPDAPYIHIGCDEADYGRWEECPKCRAFMRENGIPDAGALYSETVRRCTDSVLAHGRTPVVWEGFPARGTENISRETVVMVFQSTYQNARELTEAGFRVVNASWQPLYIVPSRPKFWQPSDIYRWKYTRWLLEDDADGSRPIDAERTDAVLGAQLCLWEGRDYRTDGEIVERNLAVLAERTWNASPPLSHAAFDALYREASAPISDMIARALEGKD